MNRYRLTDICDFQGGNQPPKSQWKDTYKNGYIRMLQIRDFTQKAEKIEYVKETNSIKKCSEDDILIARYGASIGKILTGLEGAYNVAIVKTIPNSKILSKKYLYYYLNSSIFQKYIKNVGSRAAQAGFNKKELNKLEIDLPTLDKQKIIVENLQKIQNIISNKECQIAALDNLIKSLFVEMFGDPILNNKKLPIKKLKDLTITILSGTTPKGGEKVYIDSGIEFYRSQNIWKNKIKKDDIAYIDQKTHENMKKSSLKYNDLLITKTGRINTENSSLGRTAIYKGENYKANINGHVYLVRLKENENPEFILRILISNQYLEYIRSVCVGGIDKRQLNKNHIENFPIIYPSKEKQKIFTNKVNQIDKQKFEIQKKKQVTY